MITLSTDESSLLMRVLEHKPAFGRRSNPRLRPLSMYSSELKNFTQIANSVRHVANGQSLSDTPRTAQRYTNTLANLGLWTSAARGSDIGAAGEELLQLAGTDDGQADFWQRHTRAADKIFFAHQLRRLIGSDSDRALVSPIWREAFFNVQDVVDHLGEDDIRAALEEPALSEIEALQYIDSVGTEPWRYARLEPDERQQIVPLTLRIRSQYEMPHPLNSGDVALDAANLYGQASNAYQRDVRFRVAGFIAAFLDVKSEMAAEFPRLAPDFTVSLSPSLAIHRRTATGVANTGDSALPLPLQVIISGCPGSGKSALADQSSVGALVIRTQFHAETTNATFFGSYRPAPVYEPAPDVVELSGVPFGRGRPLIDYRFVPGPALLAVATAIADPDRSVVLLIEELNRGNAAAIFGELFQLLDRGDDGWSRYGLTITAEADDWLRSQNVLGADGTFRFPPNLHLWATMNSGDQGVFPIDTAFRRRWAYRYLGYAEPCRYANSEKILRFAGCDLDWDSFRQALNRRLKTLQVVEDRLIGPYFLTTSQLREPGEVLSKLLLYLWDDVLRFRQQELFRSDSFAGVTAAWNNGEGNPLHDAVLDLAAAAWVDDEPMLPTGNSLSEGALEEGGAHGAEPGEIGSQSPEAPDEADA
ncbi:hypothetical protein BH09PSE3_BH09PSE3_23820 [soil metagenome]